MSFKIVVSCVKHPGYKAIQPPRVECADCNKLYRLRQEIQDISGLYNKGSGVLNKDMTNLQPRDFRGGTVLTPYIIKGLG